MIIKALSIVTPWGTHIAEGRKTLEIRSWCPEELGENSAPFTSCGRWRVGGDKIGEGKVIFLRALSTARQAVSQLKQYVTRYHVKFENHQTSESFIDAGHSTYQEAKSLAAELNAASPVTKHTVVKRRLSAVVAGWMSQDRQTANISQPRRKVAQQRSQLTGITRYYNEQLRQWVNMPGD